jgi:TonB family protein
MNGGWFFPYENVEQIKRGLVLIAIGVSVGCATAKPAVTPNNVANQQCSDTSPPPPSVSVGRCPCVGPAPQVPVPVAGGGTSAGASAPRRNAPVIATYPVPLGQEEASSIYPPEARDKGEAGDVQMLVGVDAQGHVRSVEIVKAAGHGFDEAAAGAMFKRRFTPALSATGEPMGAYVKYTYHFAR